MPPPTQRRMRLPESAMRPFSPIATVAARKAPLCYLRACPQAPSLRLSADDLRIAASFLVAVQKVRLPRLSLRCLVLVPHSRSGNLRRRPDGARRPATVAAGSLLDRLARAGSGGAGAARAGARCARDRRGRGPERLA